LSTGIIHNNGTAVNPCARAAQAYAAKFGWHVLPLHSVRTGRCTCNRADCVSAAKHPLTLHGVADASKDPSTIAAWWRRWPFANIGIATGQVSGIVVLDVDGPEGEESLRALEDQHGPLMETVEALTGGGGRHVLFAHPGHPVPNKVALAPGLDVRGDHGYIVAPPSSHASGRRYTWELSSRPGEVPLAACPPWLLDLIGGGQERAVGTPPDDWRKLVLGGVTEGQRNQTIARLAGHLLRRYVDPYVVLSLIQSWNKAKCRPPLSNDEVAATVDSVARAELRRRQGGGRRG